MNNKGMWIGIGSVATFALFAGGALVGTAITANVVASRTADDSSQHGAGTGSKSGHDMMADDAPQTDLQSGTADAETAKLLSYLVEEEKLAHDVYTVLGDQWGTRIFANISRSEDKHQSMVAGLLTAYGIDDPRTDQVGVFTDPELQKLYDELIAQGSTSQAAAIDVGILIENTDIADLEDAMNTTDDTQIDAVLSALLNASYNHLNAFTRQK